MGILMSVLSLLRGPSPLHIVVDGNEGAQKLKIFNKDGSIAFQCAAHTYGQSANWRKPSGDTPPGRYEVGEIYDTHGEAAYGENCIDLIDLDGQEGDNGRAGISLHGGGTGLPNPFAPYQGWMPTHGCIRVQNEDLNRIVRMIRNAKSLGSNVILTVVPYH